MRSNLKLPKGSRKVASSSVVAAAVGAAGWKLPKGSRKAVALLYITTKELLIARNSQKGIERHMKKDSKKRW